MRERGENKKMGEKEIKICILKKMKSGRKWVKGYG